MRILKSSISLSHLFFRYFLPVIAYLGLLVFLTLRSQDELPDLELPFVDKIAHFILFAGLSFFISRFLSTGLGRQSTWKIYLCASLVSIFYGTLDEFFIQPLAQDRYTEWADYLCNVLGAMTGPLLMPIYKKIRDRFFNSR
jgi:VanZ family protein